MKATRIHKILGLLTVAGLATWSGLSHAGDASGPGRAQGGNPYLVASYGHHGQHQYGDHRYRENRYEYGFYREIEQRQNRQAARIQKGIAQGEITRREAAKLFNQQRAIEHMQRDFMADGHLNRWEYAKLDRALDDASRDIQHQTHDNEWRW